MLLGIALVTASLCLTIAAMRTTSTTFDEILLPAAGARGYETGRYDLVVEQPPLMMYLYGLPVWMAHPRFPAEAGHGWGIANRYEYARQLFWGNGNDPLRLSFGARLVAALLAAGLVLSVIVLTMQRFGPEAGLLAGLLMAFLPDTLAHGGVAWNDLPEALAFLWAVWALDRVVRRPGVGPAATAGVLVALAIAVKFTAIALAPVALLLVLAEAATRGRDRRWVRGVLMSADIALAAAYLTLVVIYRGDFALHGLRTGLLFQVGHAVLGNSTPLAFLGQRSLTGWWYFFPVAFLLKTPVALHVLLAVAVAALVGGALHARGRSLLRSSLRAEVVALVVLGATLLCSDLEIGFRYALPAMPFLLILVAAGVRRAWDAAARPRRVMLALACAAYAASSLSAYPEFLAYTSEYVPRSAATRILVDSSLDWGQGLLQLRRFLQQKHVDRVYLAYFGSAVPQGYGIDALPPEELLSGRLDPDGMVERAPYVVVSATLLAGAYLPSDPYAPLRQLRPVKILARSLLVFPTREAAEALRPRRARPSADHSPRVALKP